MDTQPLTDRLIDIRRQADGVCPPGDEQFANPKFEREYRTTMYRGDVSSSALFSQDEQHRYFLTRVWEQSKPLARFIGLNPSTATEEVLDPTLRRCVQFAKDLGCGGMVMLNIFAYRSTDPSALRHVPDPVGILNDHYLSAWVEVAARYGSPVVCCWGTHGHLLSREAQVLGLLRPVAQGRLQCFGRTKAGNPKHPLYLKGDTQLERYP